MDKWELIGITIDQLISQWKIDRDSFEAGDGAGFQELQVSWSPKLQTASADKGTSVSTDPMGLSKAVVITFNNSNSELSCGIYKVVPGAKVTLEQEMLLKAGKLFITLRKNYRKFIWLREQIQARDRAKRSDAYLKELYKVFPSTFNRHILGED